MFGELASPLMVRIGTSACAGSGGAGTQQAPGHLWPVPGADEIPPRVRITSTLACRG